MEFYPVRRQWICFLMIYLRGHVNGHEKDFTFLNTNLNISKVIEMGWSLEGYILDIIPHISFESCIKECLGRRRCKSLNYKQQFPLCELSLKIKSVNSGKEFIESNGTVYTEMTEWKKSHLNKCNSDRCGTFERCTLSDSGQSCEISNCKLKELPWKRCAIADRSQGISIHNKVIYRCQGSYKLIGRSSITCKPDGQWSEARFECQRTEPFDCSELKKQGVYKSGVQRIAPKCVPKLVWCDMEEEGGGWTVLSRRIDDSSSFNRGWEEYRTGFGNATRSYWIGNDNIHEMTTMKTMDLLFKVEQRDYDKKYTFKYANFRVLGMNEKYKMTFQFIPDSHEDPLQYEQLCYKVIPEVCHNNTEFSTYDMDHTGEKKCPQQFGGGWWYNQCHHVCLTGDRNLTRGYRWIFLNGTKSDDGYLKSSIMMIRPTE